MGYIMETKYRILKRDLEEMRVKLYALLEKGLADYEVIKQSEILDELIVEYYQDFRRDSEEAYQLHMEPCVD
jgi:hypothetical protein